MKKILFATGNPTKAKRFSAELLTKGIEVLSLADITIDIDIEENGKDAVENALIKARAYYQKTGMTTIAMDDNLYLENVPAEFQPGMYVRRVGGKRLDDAAMIEHYSNLAKKYGNNGKITGRWIYGLALIKNDQEKTYTWSKEDFYLVDTPSKIIHPGYPLNSISINKKLNKYFTDITEEDKALIEENELDVVNFIAENV